MKKFCATLFVFVISATSIASAQVDEKEAIAQLESVGGRVMKISAENQDVEVSLYLAGDKVTDQHLALVKSIQNVRWLNLANTAVTDAGLAEIADLKLTKLHLEKTGVGDAGLAHLKNQAELEYLNVYGTKVSDEGLKSIAGLAKLRRLYVWQSAVTDEGIGWLKEQSPELDIVGAVLMATPEPEKKEEPKKGGDKK